MNVKILSICLSSAVFLFILDLVRREKLTFKYASLWFVLSILAILFAVFDQLLFQLAYSLGFELPSNFIFFGCFLGVVFLSLFLTIFLCQQNERNEKLVQKMGLLEEEVKRLRDKAGE